MVKKIKIKVVIQKELDINQKRRFSRTLDQNKEINYQNSFKISLRVIGKNTQRIKTLKIIVKDNQSTIKETSQLRC